MLRKFLVGLLFCLTYVWLLLLMPVSSIEIVSPPRVTVNQQTTWVVYTRGHSGDILQFILPTSVIGVTATLEDDSGSCVVEENNVVTCVPQRSEPVLTVRGIIGVHSGLLETTSASGGEVVQYKQVIQGIIETYLPDMRR